MTGQLSRQTLPQSRLIGASAPPQSGIVHLGLGSFHRAHAAVYTAKALAAEPGDWGIVGVSNRSRTVVDAMRAQDNLYSVLTLSAAGTEVGVLDVHRRTLVAADDGPQVLAAIADPSHKILTLTVSENGYHRDARTGLLDVESEPIAQDLANPDDPKTPIGLVCRGLATRHADGGAPVTVLSCDNLQSAGTMTRGLVEQFLQAAGASQQLLSWLSQSVSFPNAMVDRIVPAPTEATRAEVQSILGLHDACPVPAEAFSMWVLEDRFAAGRPKWEAAGAIFTDEVEAYELIKLRLLNGCHSLIAYLGALDGRETIPEVARATVRRSRGPRRDRERVPPERPPTHRDSTHRHTSRASSTAGATRRWATRPRGWGRTARPSCCSACRDRRCGCCSLARCPSSSRSPSPAGSAASPRRVASGPAPSPTRWSSRPANAWPR